MTGGKSGPRQDRRLRLSSSREGKLQSRKRQKESVQGRHIAPASWSCSSSSADASRVPLHLGYLVQPKNGPVRPVRSTIGAPHLSQTCCVCRADTTGLPEASKFIFV